MVQNVIKLKEVLTAEQHYKLLRHTTEEEKELIEKAKERKRLKQ